MKKAPDTFKEIGFPFTRGGVKLVAVRRPGGLKPKDACKGCYFCDTCNFGNKLACSSFDRVDGISVWFVKEDS